MSDRSRGAPDWLRAFDPKTDWHLEDLLDDSHNIPGCNLTDAEAHWIDAWDEFVQIMRPLMGNRHLPGHPDLGGRLAATSLRWSASDWAANQIRCPTTVTRPEVDLSCPAWKQGHLRRTTTCSRRHFEAIIPWAHYWGIYTDRFPPSRAASWSGRRRTRKRSGTR